MKRLLLSGLLLVFLTNLVGWQWIFIHQQNLHRESVWNSKPSVESKTAEDIIRVSSKESKDVFMINAHEMIFHGELYDINKIKRNGNETDYYCSADNEEEQIMASFDVVIKSNLSPVTSVHSKNVKVVRTLLDDFMMVSPIHFDRYISTLFSSLFSLPQIAEPFIGSATMPPEVG